MFFYYRKSVPSFYDLVHHLSPQHLDPRASDSWHKYEGLLLLLFLGCILLCTKVEKQLCFFLQFLLHICLGKKNTRCTLSLEDLKRKFTFFRLRQGLSGEEAVETLFCVKFRNQQRFTNMLTILCTKMEGGFNPHNGWKVAKADGANRDG